MKKYILACILNGIMILTLPGCAKRETVDFDNIMDIKTETSQEEESVEGSEQAEFSFADIKNLEFCFSSGAGAWQTTMVIKADGSFSGAYSDWDCDTVYCCDFSGQFTQPVKINEYTYAVQIRELNYEKEVGTEELKDGIQYYYSDAYGLQGAGDILIYLPGAPLEELSEEFRSWVGYYDLSFTTDTELPFYALNNEGEGFLSYDIVDGLKEIIKDTEFSAASLEKSISNDLLTQTEYNEKTQELYEVWDSALNTVWSTLKQTQDADTMNRITDEEREWIALKEQAAAQAGAEYEGGTMQSMVMNQKAAEMTKARVYELMELFEVSGEKTAGAETSDESAADYSGSQTQVTVTDSSFSEIQAGETYNFSDGKNLSESFH